MKGKEIEVFIVFIPEFVFTVLRMQVIVLLLLLMSANGIVFGLTLFASFQIIEQFVVAFMLL